MLQVRVYHQHAGDVDVVPRDAFLLGDQVGGCTLLQRTQ